MTILYIIIYKIIGIAVDGEDQNECSFENGGNFLSNVFLSLVPQS